ncbi:hypothetical protein DDZ14_07455 [Maritimibacter sp. 55A14]|uniref:helix-turn-helix domain-containing protein n=1 Tax=Maritimibacter sp. 55A14 TaxID=2174844 RepID=UPI000D614289|nr:helix-turn-helix domain-containing protein [Maritimibacter sp. 55A14]PWE32918.1 hypothetical protein DDZ14_07455 [Maritimibacter sp. 55A14]
MVDDPEFEHGHFEPGPYDPAPGDEDDLWFLPGRLDIGARAAERPAAPVADPAAWATAEAGLAGPLARLAARLGALDERLRRAPEGWRQRLALIEAAELSWLDGQRVGTERLALWLALRTGITGDDDRALVRAGWAARRLQGGPPPEAESAAAMTAFLGRVDSSSAAEDGLRGQLADWCGRMREAGALHPVSRAAFGYHLWPLAGLAGPGRDGGGEAAVAAARLAVEGLPGGAVFLPLAQGGAGGLRPGGPMPDRLARWIAGADQAVLAALRRLDGLEDWERRAEAALAGRSGRTPGRLVALMAGWPLVSAAMAEAETGASRAAVQRNLSWMENAGLIREVTGQARYRFWTAKL